MKKLLYFSSLLLIISSCTTQPNPSSTPEATAIDNSSENATEILLLGSDHLNQIYEEGNPNTDVFSAKRQAEIAEVVSLLKTYAPDVIMVEALPEEQSVTDSLYNLFSTGKVDLKEIEYGRNETYQIGFNLGKQLKHEKIYCVDAPGGTSQGILDNGKNIEIYREETKALRKIVKEQYQQINDGSLSIKDYLIFLNTPETVQLTHHLKYMTPARVTHGTFTNPDEMVDTAFINPDYIGAELISIFKNRDYKIYSNIVQAQLEHRPKKMLLVIGQAHVGSLQSIFRDDPEFRVIPANRYLTK